MTPTPTETAIAALEYAEKIIKCAINGSVVEAVHREATDGELCLDQIRQALTALRAPVAGEVNIEANRKIIQRMRTENVREDGTVAGPAVETYYREIETLLLADGYLRVLMDDGPVDLETRIPISMIEQLIGKTLAPTTPPAAGGMKSAEHWADCLAIKGLERNDMRNVVLAIQADARATQPEARPESGKEKM